MKPGQTISSHALQNCIDIHALQLLVHARLCMCNTATLSMHLDLSEAKYAPLCSSGPAKRWCRKPLPTEDEYASYIFRKHFCLHCKRKHTCHYASRIGSWQITQRALIPDQQTMHACNTVRSISVHASKTFINKKQKRPHNSFQAIRTHITSH